jgi:PAS domain S-box-containing protein
VTDKNGETISLNPAAMEIHGFSSETDMHRSFLKYVQEFELRYPDGEFMPVADWPSSRAVRGEYVRDFQVKLIRKRSKTYRYVNYSVTPVFDRYGEVTYLVFNMVDITERKAMEDKLISKNLDLEAANQQLGKLNDLLENLLYIAAHDLKGPLNNFRLGIELFDLMKTNEEKLELFNRFKSNYFHLEKTILGLTEILEMQQIDKCHIKVIDLESSVREILKEMNILSKIKASITWDFQQVDTITYVSAYFISIMKNLMSNAIKYRKRDMPLKIHLVSSRKRKMVMISVRDNGIGIDLKKHSTDLFKPFKRFNQEVEGTGVGLYLVHNMITQNGGRIEVESKPGKGTTFNCFFKEYKLD